MSDRHNAIVVVLERDIHEDGSKHILEALQMIKGVLTVTPHVAGWENTMAIERAKQDLRDKIQNILWK